VVGAKAEAKQPKPEEEKEEVDFAAILCGLAGAQQKSSSAAAGAKRSKPKKE